MARQKTPEELSEALSFFPSGSVKTVQRLLKRAADKQAREALRGMRGNPSARAGAKAGKALGNILAKQLSKAMRQRGATRREKPSVKQKAPDSGGRPFHFAHTTVNKDAPSAGGTGKAANKAAAHMKYMERELAVERTYGTGVEGGRPGIGARLREAAHGEREQGRDGPEQEGMTSAGAGQRYIEHPVKLANGENIVFSFGTIGDRFEDRVRFWEQLEEHEVHPGARVQNRLIVELPHEATPEARFEIVREFCKEFEGRGLPYWAALHAPGKDNDSRNFHAHIVFSERPAQRMVDGDTGREEWDFAITRTKVKASRNVVTRHPYRQNRHPDFRRKDVITRLRKSFADTTNAVLAKAPATDKDGQPVAYDARSYKDMGLDTVPMKSVDRIVADKMRAGKLTVLDRDFSKKMIRAELQEALARRDKDMMELVRLDQALEALAANPKGAKTLNGRLPPRMRVSPLADITGKVVRVAAAKVLDAKRSALSDDLMERSTRASLRRVLEATDEKVLAASARNTKDPIRRAELPSEAAARALNEAAREELSTLNAETEMRRRRAKYRLGLALNGWREVVGPRLPETSPMMAVSIAESHETHGPRRAPAKEATGTQQRLRARGLGMPVAEFNERIRQASAMTSAIIAEIGRIPDLEDRLRVIDRLHPDARLEERRRKREEAERERAGQTTVETGPGRQTAQQTSKIVVVAVQEEPRDAASSSSIGTATERTLGSDADVVERRRRERERKRKERKAVLARRDRNGGQGRW